MESCLILFNPILQSSVIDLYGSFAHPNCKCGKKDTFITENSDMMDDVMIDLPLLENLAVHVRTLVERSKIKRECGY